RSDMEYQGWNFEENYNLSNNRRPLRPQDELVELLWRDGQVVLQSQTNREQTQAQTVKHDHHQETLRSQTFLDDQETVSWLQYPPYEDQFITDGFSSHFFSTGNPLERPAPETVKHEGGPDPPDQAMPPPKFRTRKGTILSVVTVGPSHCGSSQSHNNLDVSVSHDRSKTVNERLYHNAGSSSGGSSGCSFGKNIKEMASVQSITTDRKRKHIMDTDGYASQPDVTNRTNHKDQRAGVEQLKFIISPKGYSSRRRDRINERMKALQELIPHCTKTDKASILDEAIDYMKSLKLQLQVMWMGNGMAAAATAPMMLPDVQPQPFIRQMQSPVQLPRFPVMNNPGIVCQNPVQNQVFSNRFDRYIGVFPQMQAASQPMAMLRFGSQAGQQSQQPSAPTKTTDGSR
ncbi:hypothetical protein IGI04_032936, partial [Brassica rapa subsp. trilocularis]